MSSLLGTDGGCVVVLSRRFFYQEEIRRRRCIEQERHHRVSHSGGEMMLEFFRRPDFWAIFASVIAAAVLSGFRLACGRIPAKRAAEALIIAGLAAAAWLGFRHGVLAAAVTVVTGFVVAALGNELGGDRVAKQAVV